MRRRPDRTTLTPWRIGALLQPRRPRTGRSRVVNTRPWPRGSVSVRGPRLGPGPLLDHDELAALVVRPRLVEPDHHLQREHQVAVEVAVQGVPVAGAVPEEQRGRAGLARGVAPVQPVVERLGPRGVMAAPGRPLAGDGQQPGPERGAQVGHEARQRVREVPVLAGAVAVPGHVDGRPEAAVVVVEVGQLTALGGGQHGPGGGDADGVEVGGHGGPVDPVHRLAGGRTCVYLGVHGHAQPTPRPPSP